MIAAAMEIAQVDVLVQENVPVEAAGRVLTVASVQLVLLSTVLVQWTILAGETEIARFLVTVFAKTRMGPSIAAKNAT